jgi:hypothetical protein
MSREPDVRERRAPFRPAAGFDIEEIIDPRDTRLPLTGRVPLAFDLGPRARGARP